MIGFVRRRAVLRLALLAGAAASPALAQTAQPAAETGVAQAARAGETATGADGEIVVVGTRPIAESLAAALTVQKNSDSLVSVLAADAIGRLPDQNIAQAISRLPGVSIQRDQGQARFVNLRGAPLNWTTLSFDGIFVVSPQGRDARFDTIPSALAAQVVVQKAVTPDLNGETIAGNVNVVTRSPFDYKGLHFQSKLGIGNVELGGGTEYEASAVLSNRWETGIGDIGVLVSGAYYRRNIDTDNFEVDWETVPRDLRPVGSSDNPATLTQTDAGLLRAWPRELENKFYRGIRTNYSLSGRLEWRNAGNRISLTSIYTAFTDDELRDNYRLRPDQQRGLVPNSTAACTAADRSIPAGTTGYANACVNSPLQGEVFGSRWDARFRLVDYKQSIFTNTLAGDHEFDKGFFRWRANYTRSIDDGSQPYVISYESLAFGSGATTGINRPTFTYDLTSPQSSRVAMFTTTRSAAGNLGRGTPIASFNQLPNEITNMQTIDLVSTTDAYTGRLELGLRTGFLGDTLFRFGAGFDQRTKERVENRLTLGGGALRTALTAQGVPINLNGIIGNEAYRGRLQPGYVFTYFDADAAGRIQQIAAGATAFQPFNAGFFNVREEVWSGFAMGTTSFDWGNIVYGARIEHVTNTGRAFSTLPGAGQTLTSADSSSTLVFPSAHINWRPREDMRVRLSFNSGAARPDYSDLQPSFTVDDPNELIRGGNPFAKPERAYGADLYWEWYIGKAGFVSLGVFYKDVRDVLFEDTRLFNSDILNSSGINRAGYRFTALTNGGNGYIYGAEAAFQAQLEDFAGNAGFWGGFGIQANVVYNESRATKPDGSRVSLPGTSNWVVNVGPFFEKYGVSARLAYQMRSNWFSEIADPAIGGDIYWALDEELDATIRVALTRNLEVYAEAANLLDGPGRRFIGTSARTLEWENFGRRYQAGIRVTY
jgi:TonB-dependent receptor